MQPHVPDNSLSENHPTELSINILQLNKKNDIPLLHLEIDAEVVTICFSRKEIQPNLFALNEDNPKDNPDLSEFTQPIDQAEEQSKEADIHFAIKWIKGEQILERELLTPFQRKCAEQLPRLVIDKEVLFWKFFNDIGNVTQLQFCVPVQLRDELLFRLHNEQQKSHSGIGKMIHDFRLKYYFPIFSETIVNYVRNCLTCLQVKTVKPALLRPLTFPTASTQNFPEDLFEIDLVGKMPGSQFKFVLAGIDVFTRYLFALPLRSADAESGAKALTSIFFRHA